MMISLSKLVVRVPALVLAVSLGSAQPAAAATRREELRARLRIAASGLAVGSASALAEGVADHGTWGETALVGYGAHLTTAALGNSARLIRSKGFGGGLRESAVMLGYAAFFDGLALANHPLSDAHPVVRGVGQAVAAMGFATAVVVARDLAKRPAPAQTQETPTPGGAGLVVGGPAREAQEALIAAAQARVASGKPPTSTQRRALGLLFADADAKLADAQENFRRPLEAFEGERGSLFGSHLIAAALHLNRVQSAFGERGANERAVLLRHTYATIFDRIEREIDTLSDPELNLREGRGAEDLKRFSWLTSLALSTSGSLFGTREGLSELYQEAKKVGAAGPLGFARWARADEKLAALEPKLDALFAAARNDVVPKAADAARERADIREAAASLSAYFKTREPKTQMGELEPEALLARLSAEDVADWKAALKAAHGGWDTQVAEGLKLSFSRFGAQALARIDDTLERGNPFEAAQGLAVLADLRAKLALATAHGVDLEDLGEQVAKEKLAELEERLTAQGEPAQTLRAQLAAASAAR